MAVRFIRSLSRSPILRRILLLLVCRGGLLLVLVRHAALGVWTLVVALSSVHLAAPSVLLRAVDLLWLSVLSRSLSGRTVANGW